MRAEENRNRLQKKKKEEDSGRKSNQVYQRGKENRKREDIRGIK